MFLERSGLLFGAFLAMSGCAAQLPWATDAEVTRAAYHDPAPASITLMTAMRYNGDAAHTALLINGSQRVIYDPAGTFRDKDVPERADLLYGITPAKLDRYIDYQAEEGLLWLMQTKVVAPEVAEAAIRAAIEVGAAPGGFCARNSAEILSKTPGFQSIPVEFWPKKVKDAFAALPGVTSRLIEQHDARLDLNQ